MTKAEKEKREKEAHRMVEVFSDDLKVFVDKMNEGQLDREGKLKLCRFITGGAALAPQ